jgi:hypothetical protein
VLIIGVIDRRDNFTGNLAYEHGSIIIHS